MSFSGTIENCYDSHVHWLATGQSQMRLNLRGLKQVDDIRGQKILPTYFRDNWLVGFGWDQNIWPQKQLPNRHILDELFPNHPVSFSRADGHAVWVNTLALKSIGYWQRGLPDPTGGKIVKDYEGWPTGVLIDMAAEKVWRETPELNADQIKDALLLGLKVFNQAGFTHIRDMTCNKEQWSIATQLDQTKKLTLAVEQFFNTDDPNNFARVLDFVENAKREETPNLRVKGLKVYFDGALGSEGALLSQCYCGKNHKGLQIISADLMEEIMHRTWEKNFELAVHAIGDQAAHLVVQTAQGVWQKHPRGLLHIEHAEMLRPETIKLMRGQNVQCHMQPCHWLTDKNFLKEKLGPLFAHVFPWLSLKENEIYFDFGSDSPIEPPSLKNNYVAIKELALQGIGHADFDVSRVQSHPDPTWAPNSYTKFQSGEPTEIVFRGEKL